MPKKKCPDCKGSGKYIGFNVIEECLLCKGEGRIEDKETARKKRRRIKKNLEKSKENDSKKESMKAQPGLPDVQLSFDFDDDDEYDIDSDEFWDPMYPFTVD